jgi:predicted permease
MRRANTVYRTLLYCYPAPFRHEYGRQMCLMFAEQLGEARRTGAWRDEAALWAQAARDLFTIAPREHGHVIHQDLRHALRAMSARPAFAGVAVLSLALGIGANTAIFSLWNGVLHASLPGVASPEGLVMLTRPSASGSWTGRLSAREDGPRPWVSFAEFEQLRDHASSFSALMAAQSSLNTWQVRIEGGPPEKTRGRLVSGGFFEVLGVQPAIGRLFTTADDRGAPADAVISHAYWQRRFGGRPDVLGRTLTLRDASVTVVGVAPAGFIGETSGQLPDLWLPLRLQPRVLPGSGDWLRESPPDKVMWLHVFGRLRPGATEAQAEAQANAIFQAGLESFYGPMAGERRSEFLDQRLRLYPAARGASSTVGQFSLSLTMLLAAVGILLLITCANLANLLLARGAARQVEIAVRVSLGASRGRLVRQLMTESVALAFVGGVAAIAVAYVLHGALVRRLQEAEPRFFMSFAFDVPVLAFALAATLGAALAFGALPAWQMTRTDAGAHLKGASRSAIGSSGELRAGRWLVGLQLSLSLPLLVGAGLLVRTVYNLQRPQLGFPAEGLLLARVDLGEIAEDVGRRDRVLRELQARIQRIPGVEAASFSQLGLFSGGESSVTIEVEGGPPSGDPGGDSALDRVGADYFRTLGIPVRMGRDTSGRDGADSPRVCIVNEAFTQRFFGGRPPMGQRIVTVEDDGERTAYEVVGVVGNARIRDLRDEVEPRFFLPAEQRPSRGTSRTFLVRAMPEAAVAAAVREATSEVDPALSITDIVPLEEQVARLTSEERTLARLAVVFGTVALALAAIGLYGVLSYGVTRRTGEIGIRMALGAQPRDVIAMILGETAGLVATGLALGGAAAYLATRTIASRLYGVAPRDPLTLSVATAVLLLVALVAAYVPARRASRVDPMVALHQG